MTIVEHKKRSGPAKTKVIEYKSCGELPLLKSRGPILRVTSLETHSICVKQATAKFDTRR